MCYKLTVGGRVQVVAGGRRLSQADSQRTYDLFFRQAFGGDSNE